MQLIEVPYNEYIRIFVVYAADLAESSMKFPEISARAEELFEFFDSIRFDAEFGMDTVAEAAQRLKRFTRSLASLYSCYPPDAVEMFHLRAGNLADSFESVLDTLRDEAEGLCDD